MGVALDHDRGRDLEQAFLLAATRFFLELVDDQRGGVGLLVTRQAEQLFTHGLAGEKLLTAVG